MVEALVGKLQKERDMLVKVIETKTPYCVSISQIVKNENNSKYTLKVRFTGEKIVSQLKTSKILKSLKSDFKEVMKLFNSVEYMIIKDVAYNGKVHEKSSIDFDDDDDL